MKIIAFCGIDGSGKSTQIMLTKQQLENIGKRVFITKVPFYPFYKYENDKITQYEIRVEMAFSFARYYLELLPKLEEKGIDYVLCDRHALCHIAFGLTYGLTKEQTLRINSIFNIAKQPDIIFYFDIPTEVSMNRIHNRKTKPTDTDETYPILKDTNNNYQLILSEGLYVSKEKIRVVDATLNEKSVSKYIMSQL